MRSYLGARTRGHFDTLLEQHAQYAVLLLQVEHARPQLHAFLFQVLEPPDTHKENTKSGQRGTRDLTETEFNAVKAGLQCRKATTTSAFCLEFIINFIIKTSGLAPAQ